MRDHLRDLQRKNEIVGSARRPSLRGGNGGRTVVGAVHFHCVEARGVKRKKIFRRHVGGIERAWPAFGGKSAGA